MSRAASSQRRLDDVLSHALPDTHACGRSKLRSAITQASELSDAGRAALRRYSAYDGKGYQDGKYLNNNISSNPEWASGLDEAFVWRFNRPVVLWRGWSESQPDESV